MSLIRYPEFKEKSVVVTGANSGIGYAQAQAFLTQGAQVYGLDLRTEQMESLNKEFSKFAYFKADVCKPQRLKEVVDAVLQEVGKIDVLLNTAGILDDYLPTLLTTEELWDRVMETNVKSVYQMTNLVLPYMIERGEGAIINMASIAGLVAGGGGAAYTAAKHAIVGFTKQNALDYAKDQIHINAVAPGAIRTPMNQKDFEGEGEMAKWVAEETPVKRWAEPEEVAQLTLFLASNASRYLQGAIVPIDGGWTLK